jgi:hypothetical protein
MKDSSILSDAAENGLRYIPEPGSDELFGKAELTRTGSLILLRPVIDRAFIFIVFMNELPRKTLRRILAKHGREIAGNAERCRGLLNDLCGGYRREINILVTAVEERVPLDLLAAARSMPTNLLLARLEKRLADQTGLTPEAARWAVGSWALALGLATDSEIAERESKPDNHPARGQPRTFDRPARRINRRIKMRPKS